MLHLNGRRRVEITSRSFENHLRRKDGGELGPQEEVHPMDGGEPRPHPHPDRSSGFLPVRHRHEGEAVVKPKH